MNALSLIALSLMISTVSFAQPGQSRKTVTGSLFLEGESKTTLKKLQTEVSKVTQEIPTLDQKISEEKDNCALEELKLQKANDQFLVKNKTKIQDIQNKYQAGLRAQLVVLKQYRQGIVEGISGTPAKITINVKDESGAVTPKAISIKDLVAYIEKFEKNAPASEDNAVIDAYRAQYEDPKTAQDPAFFNMTLAEATRAYERLGTFFSVSTNADQERALVIGTGKNIFRVVTTLIGNETIGSQLFTKKYGYEAARISNAVNFSQAFVQPAEQSFWDMAHAQQVTIIDEATQEEIPVDGELRRVYLDSKRSAACKKKSFNYFKKDQTPGPNLDYSQKEPCNQRGIQVISAVMKVTEVHAKGEGGRAKVGDVYTLTEDARKAMNGEAIFKSATTIRNLFPVASLGVNMDVVMDVKFTCACETEVKSYTTGRLKSYSMPTPISCE